MSAMAATYAVCAVKGRPVACSLRRNSLSNLKRAKLLSRQAMVASKRAHASSRAAELNKRNAICIDNVVAVVVNVDGQHDIV
jgi:hypothetical protein